MVWAVGPMSAVGEFLAAKKRGRATILKGGRMSHFPALRPKGYAPIAALLSAVLIQGCSANVSAPAPHGETRTQCGVVSNSDQRVPRCFNGGSDPYLGSEGGYDVYGARPAAFQYRSSVDGGGAVAGSRTGSTVSDPSDGTEHITVNDTADSLSYNVTNINAHFIGEGTTALPTGVAITKDSAAGTAVADFVDAGGTAWHASGAVDPDNVNVDVTLTNSAGLSTAGKYAISLWAPSFISAMARERAVQSVRHTMAPSAAKVAIAAGTVAGVMALVAGAAFATGFVPAGFVATGLAIGATVVAGIAQSADQDEKDKANKKC